ncbi:MAG: hypothetical protein PHF51_02130 [Candidatus ainarchaeum sp.]|nr:hypothetical protein [Candidatus ainarchaeum sp.]
MRKLFAIVGLVAMLMLGCTGGTNATPAPTPAPTEAPTAPPQATPTPVAAATPTPEATAAATPTPEAAAQPTPGQEEDWASLFGCAQTGISYTYTITVNETSMDMAYVASDGGSVNGVDTVLKTYTMSSGGMEITTREWDSKDGCRCVKIESSIAGQTIPGQCPVPGQGSGEAEGAQTSITSQGTETVSVPAYSGLATKYRVTSETGAGAAYAADIWRAPGITVPVKITSDGVTMVLAAYSAS